MDITTPEGITPVVRELATQSDRACAIVGASILENLLELLLRSNMVPDRQEGLFSGYGPLGTFRAKIDLAYSLGLIADNEARDLHRIRKIRNDFAHSLQALTFDGSPARDHVGELTLSRSAILGETTIPRMDFQAAIMVLTGFLWGCIKRAREPQARGDLSCFRPEDAETFLREDFDGLRG